MSQPAVSAQIHNLERTTGTKLFEQLGKRVHLTKAGEALFRYARDILFMADELGNVMADLREKPAGSLRLAASPLVSIHMLPSVLAAFRQEYEGIQLQLTVHKSSSQTVSAVLQNTADIGLGGSSVDRRDLRHPDLVVSEFLRDQSVVIVGADHPWTARSKVRFDEVVGEPLILQDQVSPARQVIDEALSKHGVACQPVLETNDTEVIKRAVAKGVGISIVSRFAVSREELDSQRLTALELVGTDLHVSFYTMMHKKKYRSAAIQGFLRQLGAFAAGAIKKSALSPLSDLPHDGEKMAGSKKKPRQAGALQPVLRSGNGAFTGLSLP
jgi:DNA-binding transcriptional LysR family regulator